MRLSDWLNEQRESREAFAGRVGVHPVTISKWISGCMFPRVGALRRITAATNGQVQPNDFLASPPPTASTALSAEAA